MSEATQLVLIVVGLLAIGGLLWVIRGQVATQRAVRLQHEAVVKEHEAKAQEKRDYLLNSVQVISTAMQEGQCELAEGCIRLKKLLDHLAPYLHEHEDFCAINQMYEATKHMPILDEWKKLDINQRHAFTLEREALEVKHKTAILAAVTKLSGYKFQH